MSKVLKIALVDPDERTRQNLKRLLLNTPSVWLESDCSRYEFFSEVLAQAPADVGILALDTDPEQALSTLQRVAMEQPNCVFLVISSSSDGHLILRALRAGAREFLPLPLSPEELDAAVARVRVQRFGTSEAEQDVCQVIAVAGATGGVGCTSIASNLGCLLAQSPDRSVALMDLDLALGDADVLLNLIPDYTITDIVDNVSQLDTQLLKKSLTKHPSGVYLLPRPVELRDAAGVNDESVRQIIGMMRSSFSHLIIDLSKSYTPVDLVAMQLATRVLMVTQLDLPCLRNVVRLLASFEEVDGLLEKVEIIVNRSGSQAGPISLKKAKETLGRELSTMIPNDPRSMLAAGNNGIPLCDQAPRAPITAALRELADRLGSPRAAEQETVAGGAASRWSLFWPGTSKSKT